MQVAILLIALLTLFAVIMVGILLLKGIMLMSQELDALRQAVANANTVAESAITLIKGLAAQISSNANDPAALQALADSLNAESTSLAATVTEGTAAENLATSPGTGTTTDPVDPPVTTDPVDPPVDPTA